MGELGAFKANMYLAEDRILCFEVLARVNCAWTLKYVKGAVAETDVPITLTDLIRQRRRWLNGSFFALLYAVINFERFLFESRHSFIRKVIVTSQFIYYTINISLTWLLVGNFWLAFYFLVINKHNIEYFDQAFGDDWGPFACDVTKTTLLAVYLFITLAQVIAGLGNKPDEMEWLYKFSAIFYAFYSWVTIALSYFFIFTTDQHILGLPPMFLRYASLSAIGLYFVAAFIHGELIPIVLTFPQYICMLPTFINIFNIYSFSNMHDISWGTKGLSEDDGHHKKRLEQADLQDDWATDPLQKEANRKLQRVLEERAQVLQRNAALEKSSVERQFRAFRSAMLISWLFTNGEFCYLIMTSLLDTNVYLPMLFIVAAVSVGLRFFGSVAYLLIMAFDWVSVPLLKCCGFHRTDHEYGVPRASPLDHTVLSTARPAHRNAPAAIDDDGAVSV